MLNIIYCNKPCVACCSVWHRTTTVHLVILMWITSSKISWVLQLTAWLAIAAQWSGLIVLCNVQRIVTNHTESQFFQERRAALPSPFTGGWLHMCSFRKCINRILSTLFSSTSVLFSCTPFGTTLTGTYIASFSEDEHRTVQQICWLTHVCLPQDLVIVLLINFKWSWNWGCHHFLISHLYLMSTCILFSVL